MAAITDKKLTADEIKAKREAVSEVVKHHAEPIKASLEALNNANEELSNALDRVTQGMKASISRARVEAMKAIKALHDIRKELGVIQHEVA